MQKTIEAGPGNQRAFKATPSAQKQSEPGQRVSIQAGANIRVNRLDTRKRLTRRLKLDNAEPLSQGTSAHEMPGFLNLAFGMIYQWQ